MAERSPGWLQEHPHLYHRGVLVPAFFSLEWVEQIKVTLNPRPDDIWIVTYPKSGTTWTQQIVRLLINKGKKDERKIDTAVPWAEAHCRLRHEINTYPSPRAFKTHFSYDLMSCGLPSEIPGRYIYVARNPKDVVISFYHHNNAYFPIQQWDEFFDNFIKGNVFFGDYFHHVVSWWTHRDDDNVLFLKYEDMKKDLPTAVAKIAKFIGQDVSDEFVKEVADKTTFEKMKDDPTANYAWTSKERRSGKPPFMRKGVIGDWKGYLTSSQVEIVDALCEQHLEPVGLQLECELTT